MIPKARREGAKNKFIGSPALIGLTLFLKNHDMDLFDSFDSSYKAMSFPSFFLGGVCSSLVLLQTLRNHFFEGASISWVLFKVIFYSYPY